MRHRLTERDELKEYAVLLLDRSINLSVVKKTKGCDKGTTPMSVTYIKCIFALL